MASISQTDKELQAIHKELKELNRRIDRLCRSSIFSLEPPVVKHKVMFEELTTDEEKFIFELMDEIITRITTHIMKGEQP